MRVGSSTALINRLQLMGRKGGNEKLLQSSDESQMRGRLLPELGVEEARDKQGPTNPPHNQTRPSQDSRWGVRLWNARLQGPPEPGMYSGPSLAALCILRSSLNVITS